MLIAESVTEGWKMSKAKRVFLFKGKGPSEVGGGGRMFCKARWTVVH